MENTNECIEDEEAYYAKREAAYKAFFGRSWQDIIDHWMVEDLTPEEAVDKLSDENLLDYCDHCKTYFLTDTAFGGVYRCPYCHSLGTYSERDFEDERQARREHEWEIKTGR